MKYLAMLILWILCMAYECLAFDATGWGWCGTVSVDRASSGYVRMMISPEIFDTSQPSLNDLRIVDGTGMLVPHIVYWGRRTVGEKIEWRDVSVINRTFTPEQSVRAIIDFGKPVLKNRVKVQLSGRNYRRRVQVEGSIDSVNWETIVEDQWLIDIDHLGRQFNSDTIDLPDNNFRYLRLSVFHDQEDPRTIEITSVRSCRRVKEKPAELEQVPVISKTEEYDAKNKQSIYILDLGYRNLPLTSMKIEIPDGKYYRGYELEGRNAETRETRRKRETGWDVVTETVPWRFERRGVLYRIERKEKTFESNNIPYLHSRSRYHKLIIFEGDNLPLDVKKIVVQRRQASIVFNATPGNTYVVYGGNPHTTQAKYDLDKTISGLEERTIPVVRCGYLHTLADTAAEKVKPWTERHKGIISIVLIAVVIVMIALIGLSFKGIKQNI